ncbi:recombinase family protein [Aliiruegeria lutimaris]|uniref:recombinase family protein n=1 Tax=Aliiruegeria lutimaris TaxID=571298 RepID=UPI000B80B6D3|nr:recombinase family protein [Aliiruegeria lutimaris]
MSKSDTQRAAIYSRYSSDLSSDASIEDQVRRCRAYAEAKGWVVSGEFEDRAISGASVLRPGYQDLLQTVQTGKVDVILTEALDRLSRDQEDIAGLFKRARFLGVRLETVSEGEIGELHIGLKGTMNALYLKDLADKTRRGLEGRIRARKSAGGLCYGYAVVPGEERGDREIVPAEAATIRRIFEAFTAGKSPKAIARDLNTDGIPGPRGRMWRDTAIRGHRQRGTGILNNELYVGRLVWNRLRYVKDPATGKRVSRINPQDEWIVEDASHLRIVDDGVWDRVKERQAAIDATPAVQGIKKSRFWEHRRPGHLLTGLLHCGTCGGVFASAGRDYLACSNARKLGTCDQRKGIRRQVLEGFVLNLLRERLMQPQAVEAFIQAYHSEVNSGRDAEEAKRAELVRQHKLVSDKLDGLYDAIADGLRTPGLMAKLEALEADKAELEARVSVPPPSPVRLHPNLSAIYRQKVERLGKSIQDPGIRDEALALLRQLITQVRIIHAASGWEVQLDGDIEALVVLGATTETRDGHGRTKASLSSVKVVAGVGFEPTTFRL